MGSAAQAKQPDATAMVMTGLADIIASTVAKRASCTDTLNELIISKKVRGVNLNSKGLSKDDKNTSTQKEEQAETEAAAAAEEEDTEEEEEEEDDDEEEEDSKEDAKLLPAKVDKKRFDSESGHINNRNDESNGFSFFFQGADADGSGDIDFTEFAE